MRKARARAKEVRNARKRRMRNRMVRAEGRTLVTKARAAIESGSMEQVAEVLPPALMRLDTAAGKGIIHKRNAARRKSRLLARFHAQFPGEQVPSKAKA